VIRAIFVGGAVSDSMRFHLFNGTWLELETAKRRLPDAAAAAGRVQEDLLRLDHQILVGGSTSDHRPAAGGGRGLPLAFALSDDRTQLLVTFDATG